jgi:translation initiation factor 3 subunit J
MRQMSVSLEVDDLRKLSSTLTAMINEKQKLQKTAKKKKAKTHVQVGRSELDDYNQGGNDSIYLGYDDYDDFM